MKKGEKYLELQAKKHFLINFIYLLVIILTTVIISRFLLLRMFPFLLSLIVAALSQKPAIYLSKKTGIKKQLCAVVLSATIYLGVCAGLVFLIYRLIVSSAGIINFLPQIFSAFSNIIANAEDFIAGYLPSGVEFSLSGLIENIVKNLTEFLTVAIKNILTAAPSVFVSGVVALVAACYISKDYDGLSKFIKSLFGNTNYSRFLRIKSILINGVLKLLRGYVILMLITFFELWLGFLILKIKNAYFWAFLISLIDLLPILGTGIILVPWALYCAFTGNTTLAVGIAALYIIIVVVRNFIEPKIVSRQMGINPLFILFSMYLGLKLFGGVGLVILPVILMVTVQYYKQEMQ